MAGEVGTLYEEHTYKLIVPIMFDENKIAIETNSTGLISCKKKCSSLNSISLVPVQSVAIANH